MRLGVTRKPPYFVSTTVDRLMEFMVNMAHGRASASPPPQRHAAEMQEKEPRDVLVHDEQQKGVPSATGSREGAEGDCADDMQHRSKPFDASRSNVGCMEKVSLDGRPTAHLQSPEPTLTTSLFREVVSRAMIDSDVGRIVDEQSNTRSYTELGGQAAEVLLLSEFSRGRTTTGETEDDGIDVEDWLDVTRAMLDSSGPGLHLK